MGDTINFIDRRLKLLEENYDPRRVSYITAMKETFKKIPQTIIKALTPKKRVYKLLTEIGGRWYMKKSDNGLPPLRISTPSKKNHKIRRMKIKNI